MVVRRQYLSVAFICGLTCMALALPACSGDGGGSSDTDGGGGANNNNGSSSGEDDGGSPGNGSNNGDSNDAGASNGDSDGGPIDLTKCGNRQADPGEQCDDGNPDSGDGCSATCRKEEGFTCTSPGAACEECGNAVVESTESCDDKNRISGDGCSSTCQLETGGWVCPIAGEPCEQCGDGVVDAQELCDDGDTMAGNGCAADCRSVEMNYSCPAAGGVCELCGDGIVGGDEVCDEGNATIEGGCTFNCKAEEKGWVCPAGGGECTECGNKVVNSALEQCDDGNTKEFDGCNARCQKEAGATCLGIVCYVCGNGFKGSRVDDKGTTNPADDVIVPEQCDDGNLTNGDGCSSTCQKAAGYDCPAANVACNLCGDGLVTGLEKCDNGKQCSDAEGTACKADADCTGKGDGKCLPRAGDGCALNCLAIEPFYTCDMPGEACTKCGDGLLDFGEQCDDVNGDPLGGDGCSRTCQVEPGWFCATNDDLTFDNCSLCGDGERELAEVCDDDNTTAGDGCAADCSAIAPGYTCLPGFACVLCGNGVIEIGEQCDEGTANKTAGCDAQCKVVAPWVCLEENKPCELCGDKVLGANYESCDDGGIANGDGCSSTCEEEPGYVCSGASCSAASCGDGFRAGTEECDDGDTLSGDGCSVVCDTERGYVCPAGGGECRETVCGDTVVEGDEQCDDGTVVAAGCDADCQLEPGYKCPDPGAPCRLTVCGDGFVEGSEQCDGGAAGITGCTTNCVFADDYACDTLALACNGGENDGDICASELGCPATEEGELGDCSPKAGACHLTVCEDGIVEGSEECDDDGVAGTCRGGSNDGDTCAVAAACAGGGVCVDGCSQDCTINPFYNCEGEPSECSPIIEFVAIRRFNVSNVSPNGLTYDPQTRSFIGYKTQDSQMPVELCLDGTLIEDGSKMVCVGGTNAGEACSAAGDCVSGVCGEAITGYAQGRVPTSTYHDGAYDPFTGNTLFLDADGKLTDIPLCDRYKDPTCATTGIPKGTVLANYTAQLDGGAKLQGLTVGEDGNLYVTYEPGGNIGPSIYVFKRRRVGSTIVRPNCAVASEANCTSFELTRVTVASAAAPASFTTAGKDGNTLAGIFTVPGEEMIGTFNDPFDFGSYTGLDAVTGVPITSSEHFNFYGPIDNGLAPRYGTSTLPGLLFDVGNVGFSYTNSAKSAETASDGGAFIICPQTPSEDCQLFARVCDSDADCAAVTPGTRCNLGAAVPYCSSPGDANDDRATVNAGVQDTIIDVLANDSRSESACISPTKKVVAITGAGAAVGKVCVGGTSVGVACSVDANCAGNGVCTATTATTITTVRGGSVVISNGGANVTYDAPADAQVCGFIDSFDYTADLGGGVLGTATVRVVVACKCGDGIKQGNEQCDLGTANGALNGRCSATCELNIVCGDSFIDPGEECDDDGIVSGDGCSALCTLESVCGDGIEEGVEACDDGNSVSGDTCNANCTEPKCGDGNIDAQKLEQCDDGLINNGESPAICGANCRINSDCGNSIVEGAEQCDQGAANGTFASGCSGECEALGSCGNDKLESNEECDIGPLTPATQCGGNECLDSCICENYCGDKRVGGIEECDDGNAVLDDGCTAACELEFCGDGTKQTNEQCDDGDTNPANGCTNDCRVVIICGDGVKHELEECDDGANVSGDGCSSTCKDETIVCGDGKVEFPETCDDTGTVSGDGCTDSCRIESGSCGNGTVDTGEECDDGNRDAGDTCDPDCQLAGCGDRIVQPGEYCDDGNRASGDGCSPTCQLEIL